MYFSLLVCSALAAFVACEETITTTIYNLQPDNTAPNGSVDYDYHDKTAKESADKVKKICMNAKLQKDKYLAEVNKSNTAVDLLNKNEKEEESVKGTKCETPKEDRNKYSGAGENVGTTVKICDHKAEENYKNLEGNCTEILSKIQRYDRNIKESEMICSSRLVPKDKKCIEYEEKQREEIKRVACEENLERLKALREKAYYGYKTDLDKCINDSNKDLIAMLKESIAKRKQCKAKCGN